MPTELNRIRELAGLQQEAPSKKKLKYSSAQYAQALSQLQLRNHKGELHTITPEQQKKIIDIIEQHGFGVELQNYLHKINVINKYAAVSEAPATEINTSTMPTELNRIKELAGLQQEAPAGLTPAQQQGLAALVKKYAKRKTYGGGGLIDGYLDYLAQTGVWTDAADEKEFDVALKKLGHDDLEAWEQDAEGEELEQFLELSPITAQAQNDVEKVLGKGFYNNTNLINAASDYVRSLPESAAQPVNSSVDDTIQRARAQIETLEAALKEDYKKFQGMKPYKPKKK